MVGFKITVGFKKSSNKRMSMSCPRVHRVRGELSMPTVHDICRSFKFHSCRKKQNVSNNRETVICTKPGVWKRRVLLASLQSSIGQKRIPGLKN